MHPTDPISQFHSWFTVASAPLPPSSGTTTTATTSQVSTALAPAVTIAHPETCTLSTASLPSGRVSARVVYLKELDERGFVVYSNVGTSRKGRDLFGGDDGVPNPWAALTFWWEPLERQVRVEGKVERLSPEESQAYFDLRVRGSRVGAWASRQSAVLEPAAGGSDDDDGRAKLNGWVRETEDRFKGVEKIPCPDFWGGLRIVPERIEFWQGRENRLHDRFVYDRVPGGQGKEDTWTLERLSP